MSLVFGMSRLVCGVGIASSVTMEGLSANTSGYGMERQELWVGVVVCCVSQFSGTPESLGHIQLDALAYRPA